MLAFLACSSCEEVGACFCFLLKAPFPGYLGNKPDESVLESSEEACTVAFADAFLDISCAMSDRPLAFWRR